MSALSTVIIILSFDVFNIVVKDLTVLFVIAPNLGLLPFTLKMYNPFCAYTQVPFVSLPCLFFPTFSSFDSKHESRNGINVSWN